MKTTKINKYLEETNKIGVDKNSALRILKSWVAFKKTKTNNKGEINVIN